ncbi:MAG: hypothetical protein HY235_26810 [Acidobacteria bacterium]|nr:hypothetical protein [Acidobacteriota bacterium]
MFTAVLIAADHVRCSLLTHAALEAQKLVLLRMYNGYPLLGELARALRITKPDVIIVDLDDTVRAHDLAEMAHHSCPETAMIGILNEHEPRPDASSTGIRTILKYPCSPEELVKALETAIHVVQPPTYENLYAFLPAKAGSGCSTVVLNTAAALANVLHQQVLLVEADLRSGALTFTIDCPAQGALQHLLARIESLDRFTWSQNVTARGGLHLLLSDRTQPARAPDWTDYHALLQFAQQSYDRILVDLPEVVNPGTAEVVRSARSVFVVCTQEILSLKLAEIRCQELATLGVLSSNVQMLVNRWHSADLAEEDVAGLLSRPVTAVFPNDYQMVRKAILKGGAVPANSTLGEAFVEFSSRLAGLPAPAQNESPLARMLHSITKRQRKATPVASPASVRSE